MKNSLKTPPRSLAPNCGCQEQKENHITIGCSDLPFCPTAQKASFLLKKYPTRQRPLELDQASLPLKDAKRAYIINTV